MENLEFIEKFIDINQPMSENPNRFSTLGILLRGARDLSGRNPSDGTYDMNEFSVKNFENRTIHSNLFTGLINYLIFLEQLGSIFKKNGSVSQRTNGILLALEDFSPLPLSEEKIFAIKTLRNCLTHGYGLATKKESRSQDIKSIHKFTISIERNSEIVKLPLETWNEDFSNKGEELNTTIYILDLIDLFEKLYSKLKEEIENDNVTLKICMNELKARFTIM